VRRGVTEDLQRKQDKWDNLYESVGPENISIAACPTHPGLEAKSLSDVAHQDGKPPIETLLDLLAEDPEGVLVVLHEMSQDDVARAICHPLCAICSDGDIRIPIGSEHLHPRTYGAFTRALIGARDGIYPVAMEEMIRKMTSFPAERIGVWNRGRVQEGMAGDLVVFSPADLREGCSYDTPNECAVGVRFVTVNGQLVLSGGELTTARPGQVIRQT
jgi:N-acyl-D-amino-acid deacylase